MTQVKLTALIFCQPKARRFSGESLRERLPLPDRWPAGRGPEEDELLPGFASPYLRPADVPLAFHRESAISSSSGSRHPHQDMMARLEAHGRMLQYCFSDGLVLTGHQILYHPHVQRVPRPLLPLTVNMRAEVQKRVPYTLDSGFETGSRPFWQTQAEQVILSTLLAAARTAFLGRTIAATATVAATITNSETTTETPLEIYFTFDETVDQERAVLRLQSLELMGSTKMSFSPISSGSPDTNNADVDTSWGPWRLTTALPEPQSGVHYGRARLELDPETLGDLNGLSRGFLIEITRRRLLFHTFQDQALRLQAHVPRSTTSPPEEIGTVSTHALETGLALHLSGHSSIQATVREVNDLLERDGRALPLHPATLSVSREKIRPRLALASDGSFRFLTRFEAPGGPWEAHGFPQSSFYLLLSLQHGLGATTGHSNTQLAHGRKGLKRERDLKILRNLGYAALIFYDAVNHALGLPLSDGSRVENEHQLLESLFTRLGAAILKSEGWPVQTGSLETLCSKNITTLIQGFVSQVVRDLQERDVHLYLPDGEYRLEGLPRAIVLLFHAIIADLAASTTGACFLRARTKFFENFLGERTSSRPDLEDLAIRQELEPALAARRIHQPGIGERYLLPEFNHPSLSGHANLLSLLNQGFEVSIDGKWVEEFDAADFKPVFNLEESGNENGSENEREKSRNGDAIPLDSRRIDWFELHPKFFFKGQEIPAEQASRLSRDGMIEFQGKLYRVKTRDLPSLKRLAHFWTAIQGQGAGLLRAKRRKTEETYYRLPRSQTLELLALRASGVTVRGGPHWERICRFYDSLAEERPPLQLPESFKARLQPYQMTGVQWLLDLHNLGLGGILADDMGLGKTVTSLAFLELLRAGHNRVAGNKVEETTMGACLILVPTSLTYNWQTEASRFAPEMPVMIFRSQDSEDLLDFVRENPHGGAVICTYGLLQENSELFQQIEWSCVIFDEAQNLKNITTKRTTAARQLRAAFKFCLTGTPLENHYGEFYSLFDLVVPGSLGGLPEFRERFVNPERVPRADIEFLRLKARPLLLRRTKDQVMHELPPKIETTIRLPFEENQKRIYRDIASSYNTQIKEAIATQGEAKTQLQMLTALLRLRQACSDPAAIPGVRYTGEPPKVATLMEALGEVTESGASALVFTQFLATYERIRAALVAARIPFYDINGSDSRLAREKKLRGFQEDERGAVMLMTLKTGGVGLNLVKASYIFHIEPWWNPAVENQATDRAHRMGQSRTVQVYRYLIRESVEEKIELLKEIKSRRFDALFTTTTTGSGSGDESMTGGDGAAESEVDLGTSGGTALTQEDFEYLLS